MRHLSIQRLWWLLVLVLALAGAQAALADDHKHKKKKGQAAPAAQNQVYAQACGQCHMVYHPGLLPAASWGKLLEDRRGHFGNDLSLSEGERKEIQGFLEANAADRFRDKRSRKIMASLGGAAPLRPSQIPYLLKKHHDIAEEVFARPAVGGRGNCLACHPGAVQGGYEDDNARIPR